MCAEDVIKTLVQASAPPVLEPAARPVTVGPKPRDPKSLTNTWAGLPGKGWDTAYPKQLNGIVTEADWERAIIELNGALMEHDHGTWAATACCFCPCTACLSFVPVFMMEDKMAKNLRTALATLNQDRRIHGKAHFALAEPSRQVVPRTDGKPGSKETLRNLVIWARCTPEEATEAKKAAMPASASSPLSPAWRFGYVTASGKWVSGKLGTALEGPPVPSSMERESFAAVNAGPATYPGQAGASGTTDTIPTVYASGSGSGSGSEYPAVPVYVQATPTVVASEDPARV